MQPPTTCAAPEVQLFKALTHPTRLAILDLLRGGEQCVCHLEAQLGLRQAYLSQQLALLRAAGLIADQRVGMNVYYRVARPELFALLDAAREIAGGSPLAADPAAPCPCPKCATITLPHPERNDPC
ncbi:metalloregulator ArsR/SmtB family transcription factor [Oscillochloris sp. ZM17-4]|uniref:ArsR/SmtB family transcription factor n=1 Tax=Oscillochloris sp. ZM17-4 TaxID=2866714 RepID=UPI001C7319FA|nr:metalloregulator ArsR/SmtB family transcription factor [Oscillochloris sp. ZM17-4]MBX0329725.1 metalloregulator ArsR/SmtB family transcription factor [Oscillochloris sp. ZM17-4]